MKGPRSFCLGIGAPRSGTTWLYMNMRASADLYMPPVKELRFFKGLRSLHEKTQQMHSLLASDGVTEADNAFIDKWRKATDGNPEEYLGLFPKEGAIGEISPIYSVLTLTEISVIHKVLESFDTKVFYILRNPFFRDISHVVFAMHRRKNRKKPYTTKEYDAFITTKMFIRRSNYQRNIRAWRTLFKERLKVFYFDELDEAPKTFFKKFAEEMELKYDSGKVTGTKENKSGSEGSYKTRLPDEIIEKLKVRHLATIPESKVITKHYKAKWIAEIEAFSQDIDVS